MAVMTRAQPRLEPGTTSYYALTEAQQQRFNELMEQADTAGPADYPVRMDAVAILTGLPTGDLRKCACSCWCPVIFDSNRPDAHVIEHGEGYNLGRHQCPTCADHHRETA
jgi:hypothetical protein